MLLAILTAGSIAYSSAWVDGGNVYRNTDDIELFVRGSAYLLSQPGENPRGFLVHVINNRDTTVKGHLNWSIPFLNPIWHLNTSFQVPPSGEYTSHEIAVYPFTILVVKLTVEDKTLIRYGVMIEGFTIFLASSESIASQTL